MDHFDKNLSIISLCTKNKLYNPLENVQRSYSKQMWDTWERPCAECLSCLINILYAYKIIHSLVGLSMDEAGINLQNGVTCGYDLQLLILRARTERVKSHFMYRNTTLRNDLSLSIVSIPHFNLFRRALYSHFMPKEEWNF